MVDDKRREPFAGEDGTAVIFISSTKVYEYKIIGLLISVDYLNFN